MFELLSVSRANHHEFEASANPTTQPVAEATAKSLPLAGQVTSHEDVGVTRE